MSLNPDIRDQAYQFFIEEAQELLQVLETGLLDLRENHSTPKVHELMRAAHSIKGGAASVELSTIELLAHRLEDFLKALYSDSVEFDAELESLLLQGYDCLSNPLIEQIESGTHDQEAALLAAEPIFAALAVRLEDALKNADSYIPSSNDLGVDIVASIFEIDVVQALEHLQEIVNDPNGYDLESELQGTLEMFAGFAELFNLSGFSEIIQTAQTALAQNSRLALAITQAVIADCTITKDLVLAGDREQGGSVSVELLNLAQSLNDAEMIAGNLTTEPEMDDSDGLWSSNPSDNSLSEDVFGTIPDLVGSELEEPDLASGDDEISQIFGIIPEEAVTEEDDMSQIFEMIPEAENIFDQELEDVFSTIPHEETTSEAIASDDDVSQILGTIADAQPQIESELTTAAEIVPQAIAPESEVPDLEDVFGTIPDTEVVTPTQNIEDAVESITNIFDHLPMLETAPASLSLPAEQSTLKQLPASSKSKGKSTTISANAPAQLSVRVDLERLERMNNLVGELTINRNSLELQNEQLQENVVELGQKFFRFREVTQKLQEISDRMLLEQRPHLVTNSQAVLAHQSNSTLSSDESLEFDALEMDNYSSLYAAMQNVLEEIVQLEESVDDITIFAKQSDRTINSQRQMLGQMRDELMWVRMLPLDQILQRFPRTLRDLSHKYHKPVDLQMIGTGVLVDKAVLEKLSDPLLHLLRNGFDHGIEEPDVRTSQGKAASGKIEIHAYYQGNQTVIEVKDDGKGLDLAKIAQKGRELGLISAAEVSTASQERLYDLIFEPGFSTASKVSEISGRGVGMNIVRSQIESLKGKITVTSTPGQGSIFTLRLPLTLTIAKLLVCSLGSTAFAIPSDSIEEIVIPTAEQIKIAQGQKFLHLQDKLVPIYCLTGILQYNCPLADENITSSAFKTIAAPEDWFAPLLLLRRGQKLFALEVASLISEQELVIKPYGKAIAAPSYSYGCTILGDGSLIPAFDGAALIGSILGEEVVSVVSEGNFAPEIVPEDFASSLEEISSELTETAIPSISHSQKNTAVKTIMVVDDSTALRRTMALTLEKQGYRVIQKKDGKDALDGFRQHPDLDLIICDVEMPTMNGFEFLGMRRRDSKLSQIPTFMLTSRSGAKHRNLATQLGADGYFTKPYVEQEFIGEVKKILSKKNNNSPQNTFNTTTITKKTVLLIDDSSALRRTLALSLETKGYRVLQGRDGTEGLELLRKNLQTSLVICDIEMPNTNGFEFLTSRRSDPNLARIPVVMLTSRSTDKHRNLATSLGADGYFTKPYIEEQFIQDLDGFISKYSNK